jgi:hypothetical protein
LVLNLALLLNTTPTAGNDEVIDRLRRRVTAYSPDEARDKTGKWTKDGDEPQVTSKADAQLLTDAGFKISGAGPVGNEDHEVWRHPELGQITVRNVNNGAVKPLVMTPDFKNVDAGDVSLAIVKLKQIAADKKTADAVKEVNDRMQPQILPHRSFPEQESDPLLKDAKSVEDAIKKVTDESTVASLKQKAALVTLYHGTADDVVKAILKEGIVPGKSKGGDAWLEKGGGPDFTEGRPRSAFASTEKNFALHFAGIAAEMHHANPVLVRVQMPKDEFAKTFVQDEQALDAGFRTTQPISPKWITGVAKGTLTSPGEADPFFMQFPEVKIGRFLKKNMTSGAMQTMYVVVMADGKVVAAYSPDQARDKDGKWTTGGENEIFVSPNVKENLGLQDAIASLASDRQVRFEAKANEVVRAVAGGGTVEAAIGVWADGAENSTAITLPHAEGDTLRYTAALLGKSSDQKAVLAWQNAPGGPHALYTLSTSLAPTRVAADSLKLGIAFQTIIPSSYHGGKVQILDQDGSLAGKIEALGNMAGYKPVGVQRGTGEFIGSWTSREEGKAAYDKVIQDYEKTHQGYKGSLQFSGADGNQGWSDLYRRVEAKKINTICRCGHTLAQHDPPDFGCKFCGPQQCPGFMIVRAAEDVADEEAVSPPGWKDSVERMKKHPEITNPYALSWWMKDKGDQHHPAGYKPPKKVKAYSDAEPRDSHGEWTDGGTRDRVGDAKRTYNPATLAKQKLADAAEMRLSKAIGLPRTRNNSAFDLVGKGVAIEVKTLVDRKRDEITMHPDALQRKQKEARKTKVNAYTVVLDERPGKQQVYWKAGVGSFTLSTMNRASSVQALRKVLVPR